MKSSTWAMLAYTFGVLVGASIMAFNVSILASFGLGIVGGLIALQADK